MIQPDSRIQQTIELLISDNKEISVMQFYVFNLPIKYEQMNYNAANLVTLGRQQHTGL